ncbi:MAG TPA: hypothetical protein PLU72_19480 [Candidatus Ozemobacteraceae bacterium]|nr:hypothetical protein [Candidatus Ozemobacteraceae bacterium]
MSGSSAEIFGLLTFSLTVGMLFSRTCFGLFENWNEGVRAEAGPRRRRR